VFPQTSYKLPLVPLALFSALLTVGSFLLSTALLDPIDAASPTCRVSSVLPLHFVLHRFALIVGVISLVFDLVFAASFLKRMIPRITLPIPVPSLPPDRILLPLVCQAIIFLWSYLFLENLLDTCGPATWGYFIAAVFSAVSDIALNPCADGYRHIPFIAAAQAYALRVFLMSTLYRYDLWLYFAACLVVIPCGLYAHSRRQLLPYTWGILITYTLMSLQGSPSLYLFTAFTAGIVAFSHLSTPVVVHGPRNMRVPVIMPPLLPQLLIRNLDAPFVRRDGTTVPKREALKIRPCEESQLKAFTSSARWHLKHLLINLLGIPVGLAAILFAPVVGLVFLAGFATMQLYGFASTIKLLRSLTQKETWMSFRASDGKFRVPPGWNVVIQVVALAILVYRNRRDPVALGSAVALLLAHYDLTSTMIETLHSIATKLNKHYRAQQFTKLASSAETPKAPVANDDDPSLIRRALTETSNTEESFDDESALKGFDTSTILAIFGLFVCVLGVAMGVSSTVMSTYRPPNSVRELAGQIRDFKTLSEFGWPLVTKAVNSLAAHLFNSSAPFIPAQHQELLARYDLLAPKIAHFQAAHPEPFTSEEAEQVAILKSDCWELYQVAARTNAPVSFQNLARAAYTCFSTLSHETITALIGRNRRQPLGLMLLGDPGVGKSDFATFMQFQLLHTRDEKDMWTVNMQAKYDDGYINQRFVFWEEAFNPATPEDHVLQAVKVLQVNSTSMLSSIQSEAPKKGRLPFEMLVNMYASNKTLEEIKVIFEKGGTHPLAWRRRFPMIARLKTIRTGLTSPDLDFKDLEVYSWATERWCSITIDDYVATCRLLMAESDRAFHEKRSVSYERAIKPTSAFCSLSGTNYDVLKRVTTDLRIAAPARVAKNPNLNVMLRSSSESSIAPTLEPSILKMSPGAIKAPGMMSHDYLMQALRDRFLENTIQMFPLIDYGNFFDPKSFLYPEVMKELRESGQFALACAIPPSNGVELNLSADEQWAEFAAAYLDQHRFPRKAHSALSWRAAIFGPTYVPSQCPSLLSFREAYKLNNFGEIPSEFVETTALTAYCAEHGRNSDSLEYADYLVALHDHARVRWTNGLEADQRKLNLLRIRVPLLWSIVGSIGLLVTGGLLWQAWNAYVAHEESDLKGYDTEIKTPVPVRPGQQKGPKPKARKVKYAAPPAADVSTLLAMPTHVTHLLKADPNGVAVGDSALAHNIYWIEHVSSKLGLNCWFAAGRMAFAPGHFHRPNWLPDDRIRLVHPASGTVQEFLLRHLIITTLYLDPVSGLMPHDAPKNEEVNGKPVIQPIVDQCLIEFPSTLNPKRDMRSLIVPENQQSLVEHGKVMIVGWKLDAQLKLIAHRGIYDISLGRSTSVTTNRFRYQNGNVIALKTEELPEGICGALGILINPNVRPKIIGCVTSGTPTHTYITLFDPELLIELEPHASVPMILHAASEPDEVTLKCREGVLVESFGKVGKELATRRYGKTCLVPAPWNTWSCDAHGAPYLCGFNGCPNTPTFPFPPAFAPFVLNGERKDPIWEVLTKPKNHLMPPVEIDGVPLMDFMQPILSEFGRVTVRPPLKGVPFVLSVQQALVGVQRADGEILLPALNLDTGPGLPYVHMRPESIDAKGHLVDGKRGFVVCTTHGNLANCPSYLNGERSCLTLMPTQSVMEALAADLALLMRGEVPIWLAQVSQKPDEPRDPGKYARVLTVFPFHAALIIRMYFSGCLSAVNGQWLEGPFQVSINAHCRDAHDWVTGRQSFGDKIDGGDLGSADNRFQHAPQEALVLPQIHGAALAHWTFETFEFENWKSITTLIFRAFSTAYMVWGELIFVMLSKLLTGVPLTTLLNTFGYTGARLCCWFLIVWREERRVPTLKEYFATFNLAGVGDDYSNVVVRNYEGPYNMQKLQITIEEVFSMELTDPGKKAVIPEWIPFADAPFVRRLPVFHDGFWHLGLELRSRERPKYYVRSLAALPLSNVADSVLTEHYEAGDVVRFNSDREEFRRVLTEMEFNWVPPLWGELDRRWQRQGLRQTIHDRDIQTIWDESTLKAKLDQMESDPIPITTTKTAPLTAHTEVKSPMEAYRLPVASDIFGDTHMPMPLAPGALALRELDGGTLTWTTAQAMGTNLIAGGKNLPYDVISASTQFTNTFYALPFTKFDMSLTFKINCPPFMAGSVAICFLPATDKALSSTRLPSLWAVLMNHGFLVPASQLNDIEITFPYSIMQNYFVMNGMSSNSSAYGIGSVFIIVWNPLLVQAANGPTSLSIQLYWELKNLSASAGDPGITVPMDERTAAANIRRATLSFKGDRASLQRRLGDVIRVDESSLKSYQFDDESTLKSSGGDGTPRPGKKPKKVKVDRVRRNAPGWVPLMELDLTPDESRAFRLTDESADNLNFSLRDSRSDEYLLVDINGVALPGYLRRIDHEGFKNFYSVPREHSYDCRYEVHICENPTALLIRDYPDKVYFDRDKVLALMKLHNYSETEIADARAAFDRRDRAVPVPPDPFSDESTLKSITVNIPDSKPKEKKKRRPAAKAANLNPDQDVPLPAASAEAARKAESVVAPGSVGNGVVGAIGNTIVGILSQVRQAAVGLAPYAKDLIPIVAGLLDRPHDERPPGAMIAAPSTPFNSSRTLDYRQTLHMLPSAQVCNFLSERWSFTKLARQPGPMAVDTVTTATSVGIIRTIKLDVTRLCNWARTGAGPFNYTIDHTFLTYVASSFAWVQGDVNLMLVIVAAPTTIYNFRIGYLPGRSGSSTLANPRTQGGDYVSELFSGQGYSIICRSFPLITENAMLPTGSLIGAASTTACIGGYVFIILESAIVGQDTTTTPAVYINYFVSAGDNMTFHGYLGTGGRKFFTITMPDECRSMIARQEELADSLWRVSQQLPEHLRPKSRALLQDVPQAALTAQGEEFVDESTLKCSLLECWESPFPALGGLKTVVSANISAPFPEDDIVQLMKRPAWFVNIAAQLNEPINAMMVTSCAYWRWLVLFKYWRGSMNYTVTSFGNTWAKINPMHYSNQPTSGAQQVSEYGVVFYDLTKSPIYAVNLPYFSRHYALPTWVNFGDAMGTVTEAYVNFIQNTYTTTDLYLSVGDDFGLHILMSPPQETFSNAGLELNGELVETMLHYSSGLGRDPTAPAKFNQNLSPEQLYALKSKMANGKSAM
jgi:hypothetical protein